MRRIPKNLRHRKRSGVVEVAMNSSGGDIVTNDPSLTMSGLKEMEHPTQASLTGKRARSQRITNRKIVVTCGIELTQILKQLSDGDSRVPQTKNICRSIGRHSPDTMFPKNSQCVSLGSSPSAAHLLITGIPVTLYRIYTPSPSREKELSQSWSVLHSSTLSIITYTVLRCRCSEKWQNGRRYASLAIGWSRPAP